MNQKEVLAITALSSDIVAKLELKGIIQKCIPSNVNRHDFLLSVREEVRKVLMKGR